MKHVFFAAALAALVAPPSHADTWELDAEHSRLAFASIKNDYIGEVHTFENLSGTVSEDGVAEIEIDLASIETTIDIRNERMIEHVFNMIPAARLTAELDMSFADDLNIGEMTTTEVFAVLSFVGVELDVETTMVVIRLTEDRVLAMSNDMAFVETDLAGVDAGIDVLKDLASLDSIARAVPVTARFVFDARVNE